MTRRRRRRRSQAAPVPAPPQALEQEDLLADILLRLPPQPSSLARAGSVCKIWRRLVSSPGFLRRYRARHWKPPLLGVFMDYSGHPIFQSVLDPPNAIWDRRFLLWHHAEDSWDLLGVRHGRVLIFNYTRHEFIVWDPATGDRRCVPMPQKLRDEGTTVRNGAVMCAAGDQGHVHGRDCDSSPFQLVLLGISKDEKRAVASVYSSGTGEWGALSSVVIRYAYGMSMNSPSVLIGDSLYWLPEDDELGIFKYDLAARSLSVIQCPPDMRYNPSRYNYQIIPAEDGGIGLAITTDLTLDMWDRKVGIDEDYDDTWVLRKSVKLEEITGLSRDERGHMIIHGYDEDDNVIFLRTDIGCFMVQLDSMQFKNLGKRDFLTSSAYHPYKSFYSCKGFAVDYQMVWNDCIAAFEEQKLVLKEVLNSADCRISLSIDTLILNETKGYMCLTCHFISTEWKVQKRILKFFVIEMPYNGVEIFGVVNKCIKDWNIEEKIFAISLCDSAANDTIIDMLKLNLVLKKVLPVEGKLLHNRSAAHLINLIVNECLKFVDPIVAKIRESITYIQSTPCRMRKFEEIVAEEELSRDEGLSCEEWPPFYSPTHWNTTCWLLEMALKFKSSFHALAVQDANYTYAPSFEEWEMAGAVCRLLEACDGVALTISRSCCTSNLYFHQIWKLKLALDGEASNTNNNVRKIVKGMRKTFNKYWKKSYVSLSIPVVLDPRFKYMFLEFRLTQSFGADAVKQLKRVQQVLRGLFDEYSSQLNDCDVDPTQHGCDQEMLTMAIEDNDPFVDWYQHLSNNIEMFDELDRYLNESPIQQCEYLDILNWWMVHSPIYPTLARIAKDVLVMPMSTDASKPTYSKRERKISDHHNSLTEETTEALICLRDWSRESGSDRRMWSISEFRDRDEFSIEALCLD